MVELVKKVHIMSGIVREHEKAADWYHTFEIAENCREGGTLSKVYRIQAVQQLPL